MMARGKTASEISKKVSKSESTIYNLKSTNNEFKALVQKRKRELAVEIKEKEDALIVRLFEEQEFALTTLSEIVRKTGTVVCKWCHKEVKIMCPNPKCKRQLDIFGGDKEKVMAAKAIQDFLARIMQIKAGEGIMPQMPKLTVEITEKKDATV